MKKKTVELTAEEHWCAADGVIKSHTDRFKSPEMQVALHLHGALKSVLGIKDEPEEVPEEAPAPAPVAPPKAKAKAPKKAK